MGKMINQELLKLSAYEAVLYFLATNKAALLKTGTLSQKSAKLLQVINQIKQTVLLHSYKTTKKEICYLGMKDDLINDILSVLRDAKNQTKMVNHLLPRKSYPLNCNYYNSLALKDLINKAEKLRKTILKCHKQFEISSNIFRTILNLNVKLQILKLTGLDKCSLCLSFDIILNLNNLFSEAEKILNQIDEHVNNLEVENSDFCEAYSYFREELNLTRLDSFSMIKKLHQAI